MIFTYVHGRRVPFDADAMTARCGRCSVCGRAPVEAVGIFIPLTDEMRQAVAILRMRQAPDGSIAGLCYGVCAACGEDPDLDEKVEAAITAAAARVVVQ